MENTNHSKRNILKNYPHGKRKNIFILNKSPIAKFVASVSFILGSYSAVVSAETAQQDGVHGKTVLSSNQNQQNQQVVQNSIINGADKLILTNNAKATNTRVNTDDVSAIFHLRDNSHAENSTISHGLMMLSDHATALATFIGLRKGEESGNNKIRGKMYIRQHGKTRNTTVGAGGLVRIKDNGIAENTNVLKGGELVVESGKPANVKLVNTTIKGGGVVLENEVTLEGKTMFSPHAILKTEGHSIKNNGDLYFLGEGREITANIEGSGSLIINHRNNTLVLNGGEKNDDNQNNYSYSGQTLIEAGNLKLSHARFSTSPIVGMKDTMLMLKASLLSTTVSGGHVSVAIDEESVWNNIGNSNIENLNIHEGGAMHLSSYPISIDRFHRPHKPLANKLTINGDYSSNGGTLNFYSKLEGDDSETDRMLVKGNTSGLTNVKINNLGGEGAQTDLGILLIEVKGESKGEFKQVGRNPAGAFEYFLRRGSEGDRKKNWYMISDIESFNKEPILEEKIEEAVIPEVGKNEDKANANKANVNPHEVINTVDKGYPTNPIIQFLDKTNAVNPHEIVHTTTGKYSDKELHEFLTTTFPEILGIKEKEKDALANSAQTTAPTTEIENEPENTLVNKSPEVTPTIQPKDVKVVATPNKPSIDNNKNIPQKTYQPIYHPENGSYIANLSMARNLFISDLDNRSGNYKYKDAATGEWRTSSMWIQTQGGIKQFGKTVDQLNIKGKYYSIQLGGDVAKWDIGTQGSGRIGMLAGMGKATNHSKSNITGYYSNGSVNGYNLGVYATWLTDQQNKTGLYIDTLAQYSWFNNAVNGQELAEKKYKSSGFSSSIESGYTFNIGSSEQLSYFIQPNAKITWVGINAQTHTATNKDIINYTNRGQLITRIGAKTYLQTTNNSDQQFMPFIAVNWLHQNHNTGTQLSGKSVENSSKNSAEFKIGVESKIDQRLHAWANINHQIGNYNTSDTNALVGIKYAF
ncbi:TPA: autotransporter outer membrane beta-barrel domain-containing protein [Yersinia enterocolitica]|nr:autotransporter outer membrane beta-barrel domain-containing protein [Yersinia enterocolitica]